jgi:hypothetical protein
MTQCPFMNSGQDAMEFRRIALKRKLLGSKLGFLAIMPPMLLSEVKL